MCASLVIETALTRSRSSAKSCSISITPLFSSPAISQRPRHSQCRGHASAERSPRQNRAATAAKISRLHLFSTGTNLRQSGGGNFLWRARLSHRSIDQTGGLSAVAAVVGRGTAEEIVDPPPERRRAAE